MGSATSLSACELLIVCGKGRSIFCSSTGLQQLWGI